MTEIEEGRSDNYPVCPVDLSNLKNKVAEAIELCEGDFDCLVKLNQVLCEATELCIKTMSQIDAGAAREN